VNHDRQQDLLLPYPDEHLSDTLQFRELVEHKIDGVLHSTIGILLDPIVVGLQVTDRHDREEFPAFGLLLPSLSRTLSEDR